jgi:histidine triad (HIT) family protein
MGPACLVCRELRGDVTVPGGFLLEDASAAAFHYPPLEEEGNPRPYLGHLLVVTRRHVARFGELTADESATVGRMAARLARALTEAGGAEWVYSAVVGMAVPHFPLHLLPRYPGTPRDVPVALRRRVGGREARRRARDSRARCPPADVARRRLVRLSPTEACRSVTHRMTR